MGVLHQGDITTSEAGERRDRPALGRRLGWRQVAALAVGLVAAALIVRALLGSSTELTGAAAVIGRLRPAWLAAAIVVELGSYVLYAVGQRILLASGDDPVALPRLTALALAAQALGTCLPGGYAWNNVYCYRVLHRWGVGSALVVRVLVATTLVYVAALALLATVGAQLGGSVAAVADVAPIAYVLLGAILVSLVLWARGRMPLRPVGHALDRGVERVARFLRLAARWRAAREALTHAGALPPAALALALLAFAGSWLGDAACLAASFVAVGARVPWHGLILAYSAGQLAAMLPITPGGLGVVEGSLTLALVAFGGAQVQTLAAVLLYRLVSFWGILPAGGLCALAVRRLGPAAVTRPAATPEEGGRPPGVPAPPGGAPR